MGDERLEAAVAVVLAISMTLLPALTPAPAAADTSYPLTCQIGIMNAVNMSSGYVYVVFFTSKGAVADGLQAGQCAYADRAVKPSEPPGICFTGAITAANLAGSKVNAIYFSGPGSAVLAAAVAGRVKLMNFTVHQIAGLGNGGPCLMVDHFGV